MKRNSWRIYEKNMHRIIPYSNTECSLCRLFFEKNWRFCLHQYRRAAITSVHINNDIIKDACLFFLRQNASDIRGSIQTAIYGVKVRLHHFFKMKFWRWCMDLCHSDCITNFWSSKLSTALKKLNDIHYDAPKLNCSSGYREMDLSADFVAVIYKFVNHKNSW